jgi:hypothetical protein
MALSGLGSGLGPGPGLGPVLPASLCCGLLGAVRWLLYFYWIVVRSPFVNTRGKLEVAPVSTAATWTAKKRPRRES